MPAKSSWSAGFTFQWNAPEGLFIAAFAAKNEFPDFAGDFTAVHGVIVSVGGNPSQVLKGGCADQFPAGP